MYRYDSVWRAQEQNQLDGMLTCHVFSWLIQTGSWIYIEYIGRSVYCRNFLFRVLRILYFFEVIVVDRRGLLCFIENKDRFTTWVVRCLWVVCVCIFQCSWGPGPRLNYIKLGFFYFSQNHNKRCIKKRNRTLNLNFEIYLGRIKPIMIMF